MFFLSFSVFHPSHGQNLESPKAQDVTNLELGKPIERELSNHGKHSYHANLLANQYTKITDEQKGIDVLAHLSSNGGRPLADFDAEMRPNGFENI